MSLVAAALPLATPPDPNGDPPGSIDPLGTLVHAERLADLLLPGFTARMWRARLLTLATTTAAVADRVLRHLDGREDARLDARLTCEPWRTARRSNRTSTTSMRCTELASNRCVTALPTWPFST
jgi:hypothetical protein